jgi:hypothetical protein
MGYVLNVWGSIPEEDKIFFSSLQQSPPLQSVPGTVSLKAKEGGAVNHSPPSIGVILTSSWYGA